MFINRAILSVMSSLALLFTAGCTAGSGRADTEPEPEPTPRGPVVLSVPEQMPGCTESGGIFRGAAADIWAAYGAGRGLETALVQDGGEASAGEAVVPAGSLVFGTDLCADDRTVILYESEYVILTCAPAAQESGKPLASVVGEGSVMMPAGFERGGGCAMMLDSLPSARLYVSPRAESELLAGLLRGEYDYLVSASLAAERPAGVRVVRGLGMKASAAAIFCDPSAASDFRTWKEETSGTGEYDRIMASAARSTRRSAISPWDEMMREVGESEGVDWRLLSAIAYCESRFRHDVSSPGGAVGLMQVMPVTARHFGFDPSRLSDARVNVTVAARLLRSTAEMLRFGDYVVSEDSLSIVLAGYNCGVGTLSDARRLAGASGDDPDSWEDVARSLEKLGAEDTGFRRFSGHDRTRAYVEAVRKRYEMYCRRFV